MLSDIEIAQQAQMKKIKDVAATVGLGEDDIELYGNYMAKFSDSALERLKSNDDGKLIQSK